MKKCTKDKITLAMLLIIQKETKLNCLKKYPTISQADLKLIKNKVVKCSLIQLDVECPTEN